MLNVINAGGSKVILDFSGVAVISSSFADEFIGKLVVKYGFFNFQSIITLQGMNPVIQGILHRSVAQRMMNSLQENS
ncbi:MAG: STAS-like domain-containing protein [Mojavia pulchra JT2-VF2]|uniref:STAS-like domain-containing protein n=1 Tax=Mojavia pulchra JT2-VF2 TaxID=287848 RepID=A0A951UFZ9_9NOST|nr:STAS-like domain-containing protein [Mojavia pulchra JT2-VF2]